MTPCTTLPVLLWAVLVVLWTNEVDSVMNWDTSRLPIANYPLCPAPTTTRATASNVKLLLVSLFFLIHAGMNASRGFQRVGYDCHLNSVSICLGEMLLNKSVLRWRYYFFEYCLSLFSSFHSLCTKAKIQLSLLF